MGICFSFFVYYHYPSFNHTTYKSEMTQKIQGVIGGATGITPLHYLLTQFRVMVTFIRLAFVPIHQNLDYDYPIYKNLFELPVLSSLLFLTAILYLAKRIFLKYRLVSFSICWFFLTLLPESSVLPLQDVIYEHRLYLPLAGYSIFLVSGVYYLFGKKNIKTMIIVLMMIIGINSVLTYQRNKIWMNELTLWNDTIRKSPYKARAYNNRGVIYKNLRNYMQAMADYNKAITLNPKDTDTLVNRGNIYASQGNPALAISDFSRAIEINPNDAQAYFNRGIIYADQKRIA